MADAREFVYSVIRIICLIFVLSISMSVEVQGNKTVLSGNTTERPLPSYNDSNVTDYSDILYVPPRNKTPTYRPVPQSHEEWVARDKREKAVWKEFKENEDKFLNCADVNYYRRINETCDHTEYNKHIKLHDIYVEGPSASRTYYDFKFEHYKRMYSTMCVYIADCLGICTCRVYFCEVFPEPDGQDCKPFFDRADELHEEAYAIRERDLVREDRLYVEYQTRQTWLTETSSDWRVGYWHYLTEITLAVLIGTLNSGVF